MFNSMHLLRARGNANHNLKGTWARALSVPGTGLHSKGLSICCLVHARNIHLVFPKTLEGSCSGLELSWSWGLRDALGPVQPLGAVTLQPGPPRATLSHTGPNQKNQCRKNQNI